MNAAQTSPNDLRVSPPLGSVENPAELNSADLPANQDNITDDATSIVIPSSGESHQQDELRGVKENITPLLAHEKVPSREESPFPASAYHVPPEPFTPSPDPYRLGEYAQRPRPKVREPLPHRCQFMFSDGRQCTMARSDIHPSLCAYHSDREEQLFGDPGQRCEAITHDFPELHSACRDLSTPAGVNRALAQVFRLFARRRISRQEAATFGHLAKLLLRTISLMAAESPIRSGSSSRATNWSEGPLPESAFADESNDLFASSTLSPRSGVPMRPAPEGATPQTSTPISAPTFADRAESRRSGEDEESRAGPPTHAAPACVGAQSQRRNGVQHGPASRHLRADAPAEARSSLRINTSAASVRNSPEISTYQNAGDQVMQNEHLLS